MDQDRRAFSKPMAVTVPAAPTPAARAAGSLFRASTLTIGLTTLAACASPSMEVGDLGATRNTDAGQVLVDAKGTTLYTYDEDAPGQATCSGMCAVAWPPAHADAAAHPSGDFTIVSRPDGSRQWAYKGHPLYGYFGDSSPGDINGDGADGIWHAAHP